MVGSRFVGTHCYGTEAGKPGGLATFSLTKAIIRDITPQLRESFSGNIDIAVEMHEYKTRDLEGKYTHGVYSKVTMVGLQEKEPELELDDDELLDVIEEHLANVNREVVELHNRMQKSLSEMRAMEKERVNGGH